MSLSPLVKTLCVCCKGEHHTPPDGLCFMCWCKFYDWCHEQRKPILDSNMSTVRQSLDEFVGSRQQG